MVATAVVSVMPQPWRTSTLYSSMNLAISACGMAEPPTAVRRMVVNFSPFCSTWPSRACQMVGTPALMVTPSASISSYSEGPSSIGPGKTSLAPGDRRGIGHAPGVDVEHGHHGQDGLVGRERQHAGQATRQGVEHDGAVRIQRALGVAGGARGVAQRGAGALVKAGPVEGVAAGFDQRFVGQHIGHAFDGGRVLGIGQADPGAHLGAVGRDALDQRREGGVEQHHFVFGVVDDVDELLRVQARVAGVHHHAAARDGVIGLQVAVVVPGDRAHRAAGLQPQTGQRVGQLARAHGAVGVGVAKEGAVGFARHHFGVGRIAARRVRSRRTAAGGGPS